MQEELKTEQNLPMNVEADNLPVEAKKEELVKAEELTKVSNEILSDIKEDREEIDDVLKSFKEMVVNGGDASNASKEALVNLLKIKSDTADKKTKVMELLMRAFLKERDTFPRYMAQNIKNQFNVNEQPDKRALIDMIDEENRGASK